MGLKSGKVKVDVGSILRPDVREISIKSYTLDDFKIGDIKRYYLKVHKVDNNLQKIDEYIDNLLLVVYGVILDKQVIDGRPCVRLGGIVSIGYNTVIQDVNDIAFMESVRFNDPAIRDLFKKGELKEVSNRLGFMLYGSKIREYLNQNLKHGYMGIISSNPRNTDSRGDQYLYITMHRTYIECGTEHDNKNYNPNIRISSKLSKFDSYEDDLSKGIRMRVNSFAFITKKDIDTILNSLVYSLPGDVL